MHVEYLRWILLLLGVAVLLLVYFVSRGRSKRNMPADQGNQDDGEYIFDEIDSDSLFAEEIPTLEIQKPPEPAAPRFPDEPLMGDLFGDDEGAGPTLTGYVRPEKIIVLHVCARNNGYLRGTDLVRIFEARGYQFGDMNIYHLRVAGNATVFSIVSMVEPGCFNLSAMEDFSTPGISFFLRLPGPLASNTAFEVLLRETRAVALELDAAIFDASHSTFTRQAEQHIREDLQQYDFQSRRGGTPAS